MKSVLAAGCAFFFLVGCGVDRVHVSQLSALANRITIEGQEAEDLISALFQSGVRDRTGRLGALHLEVEAIDCTAPVVPHPIPHCTVSVSGAQKKEVPSAPASVMFRVLQQHGAVIPRDLLGITIVAGYQVDCQRSMVRNGTSQCSFNLPAPG